MNIMDLFRGGQQNMLGGQPQQGGNMLAQPQQMPQPAQPGFFDRYHNFTSSDRGRALNDFFTGLALGKTPQESLGYGAKLVAAGRAGREGDEKSQQQKNQTVQWLQSQGIDPQEAGLIANDPKVLAEFLKQQFAPKADERTSAVKNYQFAKQQGYEGSFADWEKSNKGGTTINLPGQPAIGSIPQGYAASQDPITHEWSMKPIAGGPAAQDMQSAQEKKDASAQGKETFSDVIVSAADKARKLAGEGMTTGLTGAAASFIPNTDAAELYRQVDVLKANATIENLNAMRRESPTGGALGNVTDSEGAMLAAKAGALDPKSPYFQQQLNDYEHTLLRVIHGHDIGDKIWSARGKNSTPDPLGIR